MILAAGYRSIRNVIVDRSGCLAGGPAVGPAVGPGTLADAASCASWLPSALYGGAAATADRAAAGRHKPEPGPLQVARGRLCVNTPC